MLRVCLRFILRPLSHFNYGLLLYHCFLLPLQAMRMVADDERSKLKSRRQKAVLRKRRGSLAPGADDDDDDGEDGDGGDGTATVGDAAAGDVDFDDDGATTFNDAPIDAADVAAKRRDMAAGEKAKQKDSDAQVRGQ